MKIKTTFYDKAEDHFQRSFANSLPIEQAYVHIGMYLGWMIEANLCSDYFKEEASTEIFRFRRREISCTILSEIWNGALACEYFNAHGNHFTLFYYASGLYLHDYTDVLGKSLRTFYKVDDNWDHYAKIKARIDLRYAEWRKLKTRLSRIQLSVVRRRTELVKVAL